MPYLLFSDSHGRKMGAAIDSASVVGREAGCDIHIPNPMLSRRHCRFVPSEQGWVVEDLKSSRGTFIKGQGITQRRLRGGEVIVLGDISVTFSIDVPAGAKIAGGGAARASAVAKKPRSLEDEVLELLTRRHDDDEDDDSMQAESEEDFAAIARELGGDVPEADTAARSETRSESETAQATMPAETIVAPTAASKSPDSSPEPYVRPETPHRRGANLWDKATFPAPSSGKKGRQAPAPKAAAPMTSASSAPQAAKAVKAPRVKKVKPPKPAKEPREPGTRPAWMPDVNWDAKTIVTMLVVGLVVLAVVFETAGDSIAAYFHSHTRTQTNSTPPPQPVNGD